MTSPTPLRLFVWLLALALLALPLVGLFAGWFAESHWPVRNLRVDGSFRHVSAELVRDRATPLLQQGFFAVDPRAIRGAVEELPWVARAEVRKYWPDEVRITVRERVAAARWNEAELLDPQGNAFAVLDVAVVPELPRLSGPPGSEREVLDFFVRAQDLLEPTGIAVAALQRSRRGGWELTLPDGATVIVGATQPWQRLRRFVAALAALRSADRRAFERADLRYSNGFALRWPDLDATGNGGSAE